MADDLTNVSYVTLALIGDGGASPHDLVDMNRRGGQIYYAVAASRLYAEPKRLETLGYVTSEKRPGKTRERTFYTLTAKGRAALRDWMLEPPAAPAHPERGRPEAHVRRHPRRRRAPARVAPRAAERARRPGGSGSPRATGASSRCPTGGATCSSSTTSASG